MFEASLIESAKRKGSAQRWHTLPLSVLIHVVVIGTAAGLSIWFIEDIPEPPIRIQFYSQAAPPQPPPAPPSKAAPAKQTQKVEPVKSSQMTSPIVIPDTLPPPTSVPEPDTGVEGREDGVPGGIDDGVPGGETFGVWIGSMPGEKGGEPLRVGGEVKEPVEISRVKPSYPEAARKAHMQGVCILESIITKTGDVESVRVLRGLNPLLDNAAIRAVSQWKYKPATFNGRPVPVYLTVTVTFMLQ